jgi:hypothetical protein
LAIINSCIEKYNIEKIWIFASRWIPTWCTTAIYRC